MTEEYGSALACSLLFLGSVMLNDGCKKKKQFRTDTVFDAAITVNCFFY